MKRLNRSSSSLLLGSLIFGLLVPVLAVSQASNNDPYKQTLDRLAALTRESESEWRFHSDIPHPENPAANDADWSTWTVKNGFSTSGNDSNESWAGTRVFRRWIQIPEKIN